jgi:capsule polysaccharide modification protein KpsS
MNAYMYANIFINFRVYASKYCNTNVLKYFHKYGCHHIDEDVVDCAIQNGNLDCLMYAHINGYLFKNYRIHKIYHAARYGKLVSLKYLHRHGYPWNERTCDSAVYNGHVDCLMYAYINGSPWNEWTRLFSCK